MHCWILPEEGLNKGLNYEGKLVVDCPEMNALDVNPNKDIRDAVCWHASITWRLSDTDLQKFRIMTQKKGESAYMRLWDPYHQENDVKAEVPSSSHIIGDMMHIHNETYMLIYLHYGVALEGQEGRRRKNGVRPGH
eukprot:13181335-Ditylum_brightwellii.AAC.1